MPLRGGRGPVQDPASQDLWLDQRAEEQIKQGFQDYLSNSPGGNLEANNMGASVGRFWTFPSPINELRAKECRAWCSTSSAGAQLAVAIYYLDPTSGVFKLLPRSEAVLDGASTGLRTFTYPNPGPDLVSSRVYGVATMSNNSTARWLGRDNSTLLAGVSTIPYNSSYSFPSEHRVDSGSLTTTNVDLAHIALVSERGTRYM